MSIMRHDSCPKKFLSKRLLERHERVKHEKGADGLPERKPKASPKFEYKPEIYKCDESRVKRYNINVGA